MAENTQCAASTVTDCSALLPASWTDHIQCGDVGTKLRHTLSGETTRMQLLVASTRHTLSGETTRMQPLVASTRHTLSGETTRMQPLVASTRHTLSGQTTRMQPLVASCPLQSSNARWMPRSFVSVKKDCTNI